MKRYLAICIALIAAVTIPFSCAPSRHSVKMDTSTLKDKIKGGWAGQTIGCAYGGPTEFRYRGMTIPSDVKIEWNNGRVKWYFDNAPGLYDDIYMDLTFVEVFDRLGLDAPVDSFASAYAHAKYPLWHANQAARSNILNGIAPPLSGYWKNNPHADDIDFQIESDFAGLMSPGMPNAAAGFADKIGHIMNYGNGWYGGVYVSAMYSLAFVCNDVRTIAERALEMIPPQSDYRLCMEDILRAHDEDPLDWKKVWNMVQENYSTDIGCPEGVEDPLNIDALINSAYVLIGLLYGGGDFGKTLEIATRCGQDSDCNPSTAGGILGTMLGYDAIPGEWKDPLAGLEHIPFSYTDISLEDVYGMSYRHALEVIRKEGGKIKKNNVTIACQEPSPVRYEKSFEGITPGKKIHIWKPLANTGEIRFNGCGVAARYYFDRGKILGTDSLSDAYEAEVEAILDGKVHNVRLPLDEHDRKQELFFDFDLLDGEHVLSFHWKNPVKGLDIVTTDVATYKNK